MKAAFVLLFLAVMVILPEDASAGWWGKKWQQAKTWVKSKVDALKKKIVAKLTKTKRSDEPLTDGKLLEILATRNVHELFEEGELDDSEKEMLSEMQRYARNVMEEDDF